VTRRWLVALAVAFALDARSEECKAPVAPAIPSGTSASDAEMVAARGAVASFVSASDAYLVCLARKLDELDPNAPEADGAAIRSQHDAAAARMRDVAAAFNAELRIWEKR
jgi:hypothetical protein